MPQWLRKKLNQWLLKLLWEEHESKKLTDRQKLIAYKDAYFVENLKEILTAQNNAKVKLIALKVEDPILVAFYRGMIASNQNLLKRMKKAHEQWVIEQTKV